ncbi:hypothetical protein ZIOFF_061740 [Zingiber officinale]|uniref:C2 NT-type domain-containing protein n=2 Tax=Zingiber officinale TaxID=94328 RepID=A0A8J5KEU5_ZINOF|nr:hypothetical protein ZIOFF_061740 [Zingiber officinale]
MLRFNVEDWRRTRGDPANAIESRPSLRQADRPQGDISTMEPPGQTRSPPMAKGTPMEAGVPALIEQDRRAERTARSAEGMKHTANGRHKTHYQKLPKWTIIFDRSDGRRTWAGGSAVPSSTCWDCSSMGQVSSLTSSYWGPHPSPEVRILIFREPLATACLPDLSVGGSPPGTPSRPDFCAGSPELRATSRRSTPAARERHVPSVRWFSIRTGSISDCSMKALNECEFWSRSRRRLRINDGGAQEERIRKVQAMWWSKVTRRWQSIVMATWRSKRQADRAVKAQHRQKRVGSGRAERSQLDPQACSRGPGNTEHIGRSGSAELSGVSPNHRPAVEGQEVQSAGCKAVSAELSRGQELEGCRSASGRPGNANHRCRLVRGHNESEELSNTGAENLNGPSGVIITYQQCERRRRFLKRKDALVASSSLPAVSHYRTKPKCEGGGGQVLAGGRIKGEKSLGPVAASATRGEPASPATFRQRPVHRDRPSWRTPVEALAGGVNESRGWPPEGHRPVPGPNLSPEPSSCPKTWRGKKEPPRVGAVKVWDNAGSAALGEGSTASGGVIMTRCGSKKEASLAEVRKARVGSQGSCLLGVARQASRWRQPPGRFVNHTSMQRHAKLPQARRALRAQGRIRFMFPLSRPHPILCMICLQEDERCGRTSTKLANNAQPGGSSRSRTSAIATGLGPEYHYWSRTSAIATGLGPEYPDSRPSASYKSAPMRESKVSSVLTPNDLLRSAPMRESKVSSVLTTNDLSGRPHAGIKNQPLCENHKRTRCICLTTFPRDVPHLEQSVFHNQQRRSAREGYSLSHKQKRRLAKEPLRQLFPRPAFTRGKNWPGGMNTSAGRPVGGFGSVHSLSQLRAQRSDDRLLLSDSTLLILKACAEEGERLFMLLMQLFLDTELTLVVGQLPEKEEENASCGGAVGETQERQHTQRSAEVTKIGRSHRNVQRSSQSDCRPPSTRLVGEACDTVSDGGAQEERIRKVQAMWWSKVTRRWQSIVMATWRSKRQADRAVKAQHRQKRVGSGRAKRRSAELSGVSPNHRPAVEGQEVQSAGRKAVSAELSRGQELECRTQGGIGRSEQRPRTGSMANGSEAAELLRNSPIYRPAVEGQEVQSAGCRLKISVAMSRQLGLQVCEWEAWKCEPQVQAGAGAQRIGGAKRRFLKRKDALVASSSLPAVSHYRTKPKCEGGGGQVLAGGRIKGEKSLGPVAASATRGEPASPATFRQRPVHRNRPSSDSASGRDQWPYLRKFVLNFFDEDHLHYLYKVLTLLHEHSLFVKRAKCSFGTTKSATAFFAIHSGGDTSDARIPSDDRVLALLPPDPEETGGRVRIRIRVQEQRVDEAILFVYLLTSEFTWKPQDQWRLLAINLSSHLLAYRRQQLHQNLIASPMAGGGKDSNAQLLHELDALTHTMYQSHTARRTASLVLPRGGAGGTTSTGDAVTAPAPSEPRPRSRRMSMSPWRSRPKSQNEAEHGDADDRRPPAKQQSLPSATEAADKKGIWGWKPMRALSHIGMQRLSCLFSVEVVAIQGLPASMNGLRLLVSVRKKETKEGALQTMPSRVLQGAADFEETLFVRCHVYCTGRPLKFEPRPFLIFAMAIDAPELDFGRSTVDLSQMVKESMEKSFEGARVRQWNSSFPLAGKAKGGEIVVKLSFQIMEDGGVGLYKQPESGGGRSKGKESSFSFARKKTKSSFSISSPKITRSDLERPLTLTESSAVDPNEIEEFSLDDPAPQAPPQNPDDLDLPDFEVVDKGIEIQGEKEKRNEAEEEEEEAESVEAASAASSEVVKEVVVHDSAHLNRLTELDAIAQQIKALESLMIKDEINPSKEEQEGESQPLDAEEDAVTREFLQLLELEGEEDLALNLFDKIPQPETDLGKGNDAGDKGVYVSDLGKGLGSVVQTRDGGYLAATNPFDAPVARKETPKLAMQISKPFILGDQNLTSGFDLFQKLASIGVEELGAKLQSLTSMDELMGKTAEQIAFEGMASSIISGRSKEGASSSAAKTVALLKTMAAALGDGRKERILTGIWNAREEPVAAEEILAFALQKIEAMAVEALKIQAGMAEEEAPFEVSAVLPNKAEKHPLDSAIPPEGWESTLAGAKSVTMLVVVQLRDPLRRYETVGAPAIAVIQASKLEAGGRDEEEEEAKYKVGSLHVGGMRMRTGGGARRSGWDGERPRLTARQWLVAYGLGKAGKKKAASAAAGKEAVWSLSSRIMADMWLKPMRNPDVKIPDQ